MTTCDLCIFQGDDWAAWVTVLNAADGSVPDLTGWTANAQIREGPADQVGVVAAEITATVVTPNNVSLYLPSLASTGLYGLYYCWDLQLTTNTGMLTTIVRGDVTVTKDVTREPGTEGVPQSWAVTPQVLPLPWLSGSPSRGRRVPQAPLVRRVR